MTDEGNKKLQKYLKYSIEMLGLSDLEESDEEKEEKRQEYERERKFNLNQFRKNQLISIIIAQREVNKLLFNEVRSRTDNINLLNIVRNHFDHQQQILYNKSVPNHHNNHNHNNNNNNNDNNNNNNINSSSLSALDPTNINWNESNFKEAKVAKTEKSKYCECAEYASFMIEDKNLFKSENSNRNRKRSRNGSSANNNDYDVDYLNSINISLQNMKTHNISPTTTRLTNACELIVKSTLIQQQKKMKKKVSKIIINGDKASKPKKGGNFKWSATLNNLKEFLITKNENELGEMDTLMDGFKQFLQQKKGYDQSMCNKLKLKEFKKKVKKARKD